MSERSKPSQEEIERSQEAAQARLIAELLALCEDQNPPPQELRESGPEILELERLFDAFEVAHSIVELQSITDLTPAEASNHPLRKPAKDDLIPIVNLLNTLKDKTNISPKKYQELQIRYNHLSRAVGHLNNNKVDHDR